MALTGLLSGVFGTRHDRERKRVQPIVDEINEHYARLQTVSEEELKDALCVAWTRLKLAIEPTAALTLAAYRTGRVPPGSAEHPTVIVLSGGNFDPATVAGLLTS